MILAYDISWASALDREGWPKSSQKLALKNFYASTSDQECGHSRKLRQCKDSPFLDICMHSICCTAENAPPSLGDAAAAV